MKYIYVYVENNKIDDVIKYGMKLSEFADKVLSISKTNKSGITAYLSPKDSLLYDDNNYSCIKVLTNNINCLVYNNICINSNLLKHFICDLEKYEIGSYEDPICFITSTILPENIQIYNKIQDVPLIIEDSKQYYYEKAINSMIENDKLSKYELYQMLLIFGEQKKIYKTVKENNVKIYVDKTSGKKYTKKSSF